MSYNTQRDKAHPNRTRVLKLHLKQRAKLYGLTQSQLTDLCLDICGSTFGDASEPGARLVLNRMLGLGPLETNIYVRKITRGEAGAT